MSKVLILNGHPLQPSFSGAVADHYADIVSAEDMEIRRLDLAEMSIPDLTTRKPGTSEMTGDVARFWADLQWADHVVVVHPLWWGGMPAKLKALFDIGLQSGHAYRYEKSNPLPLGLLKGRSARLIVTSDTPNWFMALGYGNAHFQAMRKQIFAFIGFKPVRTTHLSIMRHASADKRARLLEQVARDAGSDLRGLQRRKNRSAVPA